MFHELKAAGIPVAVASDNIRDQFYAYGDLDMLEVFNQVSTARAPRGGCCMPACAAVVLPISRYCT